MNESETHTEPVPGSHRIRWCLLFAIAIGACTFVAYFRAFSTFAEYDDEGYVMVSLQQHLKGGALFDDVYSQYGPAWYAIQSTFHRAFSLPVTHDITRFKTIVVWVLASSLAAFVVWNLTKCRTISLGSLLLAFLHLDRLVLEPGHPQELALLCVLAVLAIGTHRNSSVRGLWLLVMSAVVAVAVMTKLNVGSFLVASVTVWLSLQLADKTWRRRLAWLSVGLIVAGAILLTGSTFDEPRGLALPLLIMSGTACTVSLALRSDVGESIRIGSLVRFHSGWMIGASLFVAWALVGGTTPSALLDGLVLQHRGFTDWFYYSPPVYSFAVPLALATFAACVLSLSRHTLFLRYGRLGLLALLVGIVLRHFTDAGVPVLHGLDDRAHAGLLVSLVPLAVALLLSGQERIGSGRICLAAVASLQPLLAFPVAGTQMAIGSLPVLLIVLVCIHDLVLAFAEETATGENSFANRVRTGVVVGSFAAVLLCAFQAERRWASLVPLNLNGAKRLRVARQEAEVLRGLVREIRANGDTFVSLHNGYNSLYLLADVEPPTGMNATFWSYMLNDRQQRRVIDALESTERVCCIEKVIPGRLKPPETMLGNYLNSRRMVQQASVGIWRIMVPANATR